MDVVLIFPVNMGTLPTFTASGDLPLKNDLQAVCDSQHAGSWESLLLSRKERHSQRVFPGLYFA